MDIGKHFGKRLHEFCSLFESFVWPNLRSSVSVLSSQNIRFIYFDLDVPQCFDQVLILEINILRYLTSRNMAELRQKTISDTHESMQIIGMKLVDE